MKRASWIPGGLLLLSAVTSSCGPAPADESALLETLPGGHDLYLSFRPEEIGMERLLASLGRSLPGGTDDPVGDPGALGFDPFDWSEWSERLALDGSREIGLIVDFDSGEAVLVALYLPSSDPGAVERLFSGLAGGTDGFEGVIGFRRAGDWTVAIRAADPETLDGFETAGGPDLTADPEYARLTEIADGVPRVLSLYAGAGASADGSGLRGVLLLAGSDGARLDLRILTDFREEVVGEYTALLAEGPRGADVRLPGSPGCAVRLSLDMDAVEGLLASTGLDRELGQGLGMFGFETLEELLALFDGDIHLGVRLTGDVYEGVLELGLLDPAGMQRLLGVLHGMATAAGEGPETFEQDGSTCYRMESPGTGGAERLEIGVLDDRLVIAGGVTLAEVSGGPGFRAVLEESGLGIPDEGGLLFVADPALLGPMTSIDRVPGAGEALAGIGRIGGSLRTAGGLIDLRLTLLTEGEEPFVALAEAVGAFAGTHAVDGDARQPAPDGRLPD